MTDTTDCGPSMLSETVVARATRCAGSNGGSVRDVVRGVVALDGGGDAGAVREVEVEFGASLVLPLRKAVPC